MNSVTKFAEARFIRPINLRVKLRKNLKVLGYDSNAQASPGLACIWKDASSHTENTR